MAKKYYSLNETIKILSNQQISRKTIAGYVREEIIKPVIYLNSIPVYACEVGDDGKEAIAIGYCNISAYWSIGPEIINVFDNLLTSKNGTVELFAPIMRSKLVEEPKIFGWRYHPDAFKLAPPRHVKPKPQPNGNQLYCFMITYPYKKTVTLSADDLLITHNDISILLQEALENPITISKIITQGYQTSELTTGPDSLIHLKQNIDQKVIPINIVAGPEKSPCAKKNKTNPLVELISELHRNSSDKSPRAIWGQIRKLSNDEHPIIQEATPWTAHDAKIEWKSHRKKERSVGRRRFENIISKLNCSN